MGAHATTSEASFGVGCLAKGKLSHEGTAEAKVGHRKYEHPSQKLGRFALCGHHTTINSEYSGKSKIQTIGMARLIGQECADGQGTKAYCLSHFECCVPGEERPVGK